MPRNFFGDLRVGSVLQSLFSARVENIGILGLSKRSALEFGYGMREYFHSVATLTAKLFAYIPFLSLDIDAEILEFAGRRSDVDLLSAPD